jgi:putative copper resistance protein D
MGTAETLLIATRAVHFGAAMVLFGEMLFAWFVAPRGANSASAPRRRDRTSGSSETRFFRVAVAAWACMVVSGACWFVLVAVQMSGRPLEALDGATITTVLGSTVFGRTWVLRTVLALALAGMSAVLFAETASRPWTLAAMVTSGALLATLAWSGHANAEVGPDGVIHHLSDSIHLLAAGTWLGGLAPLAALLRQVDALSNRRALANCAKTVTRFGNAAALCVTALVMTGIVNACYLLPDWSSLVQTTYGRLLLFKICAFLIMLAIAGVNRKRLTPALNRSNGRPSSTTGAAQSLRRNVFLEQVLGALVILLVAALGVSPPPMRM